MLPSFVLSSAVAMSGERDGASAGRRRRERRLRSFWRHEQQAVAAALATAHHHSYDRQVKSLVEECERQEEVEFVSYAAPRGQNTPPPGTRPGFLVDPGPALAAVSRGSRVDGGAPLLSPVVLVGGPAHDDATVKFLVMSALRRDEEERKS